MSYSLVRIVRLCALALPLLLVCAPPSRSLADPGGVELVNGGRINGDIMAVLPGDHVAIRLADGTAVSVVWADVRRVHDGPRVYDPSGPVIETTAPATTAPTPALVPPAPAVYAPQVYTPTVEVREAPARASYPARVDPAQLAYARQNLHLLPGYDQLPRRGGTVWLLIGGISFTVNGAMMVTVGSMVGCFDDYYGDYDDGGTCGFRKGMIAGGVLSMSLGAVMFARSMRRRNQRNRGVQRLLSGQAVAGRARTLDWSLDARVDRATLVPSLTLAF